MLVYQRVFEKKISTKFADPGIKEPGDSMERQMFFLVAHKSSHPVTFLPELEIEDFGGILKMSIIN